MDWLEFNISENEKISSSTLRFIQSCYRSTMREGPGTVTDSRVIKYTWIKVSDPYSTKSVKVSVQQLS